jgi:DNA-3-methyladenine glycosylase II
LSKAGTKINFPDPLPRCVCDLNFDPDGVKKLMKKPLDQLLIRKAVRHLKTSDRALSGLIVKHGPCKISPALDNPFHALASSIVSQQISAHAARAIKGRLFDLLGTQVFTPQNVLKISAKNFRAAGLSRRKFDYLHGLASAIRNGDLDFASIATREDEEVISKLTTFSGIGRWTAEMFLIFGLGRPDVLSVNDAGLKKGFKVAYNLPQSPSADEMISISEPWRPYRSVGSWYLWRVVD